jgi:hypothetical protein
MRNAPPSQVQQGINRRRRKKLERRENTDANPLSLPKTTPPLSILIVQPYLLDHRSQTPAIAFID